MEPNLGRAPSRARPVAGLAATGLVAAATTAAHAVDPQTIHHTCSVPNLAGRYDVTLVTETTGFGDWTEIRAGQKIPKGLCCAWGEHPHPPGRGVRAPAAGARHGVTIPDFAADFGPVKLGVPLVPYSVGGMTQNADGSGTTDASYREAQIPDGTGYGETFEARPPTATRTR